MQVRGSNCQFCSDDLSNQQPRSQSDCDLYYKLQPETNVLLHDGQACGVQHANLGTSFSTVGQCLAVALNTAGCGRAVMWSTTHNSAWGCRCCTDGGFDGGNSNSNWAVWGAIVTNAPTTAPTITLTIAPTRAPTGAPSSAPNASPSTGNHCNHPLYQPQ